MGETLRQAPSKGGGAAASEIFVTFYMREHIMRNSNQILGYTMIKLNADVRKVSQHEC